MQVAVPVSATFAVPFCTRPDPGEDDYVLVIGPSFASWHTPSCKGRMKILAAVIAPVNVRRVLESLGLPSEAPRLRPARPPPQTELGDAGLRSDEFYADPPCPEE